MNKYFSLFFVFYLLCGFSANAGEGRYTIPLTGSGYGLIKKQSGRMIGFICLMKSQTCLYYL